VPAKVNQIVIKAYSRTPKLQVGRKADYAK